MTGVEFGESHLHDVRFGTCVMDYALFGSGKLRTSRFESCKLDFAHFYSTQLETVAFADCSLEEVTFEQTSLAGIDLSSNHFTQLKVGLEEIKGSHVSPMQALQFATLFGLVIKE